MSLDISPIPDRPSLGVSQLCWLRDKVPSFADAHDAAERAQIHASRVQQDLAERQAQRAA